MCANAKKPIDINKQGLNSVKNKVVQKNLMGVSESMTKKGWKDSQGRSGKVCGYPLHHIHTLHRFCHTMGGRGKNHCCVLCAPPHATCSLCHPVQRLVLQCRLLC